MPERKLENNDDLKKAIDTVQRLLKEKYPYAKVRVNLIIENEREFKKAKVKPDKRKKKPPLKMYHYPSL